MSEASDAAFLNRLRDSKQYATLAAHILSGMGYPVTIRPVFERPDVRQRADYADHGDLEIIQVVEVKHRQELHFTSREDYPFKTIIVDMASSYDAKRPKPVMYMIFNSEATHYALVMCRTFKQWRKRSKLNSLNNVTSDYYECPINLVEFREVKNAQAPAAG